MLIKNQEGSLQWSSPKHRAAPASCHTPQPGTPVPGGSSQTSGCENQWGLCLSETDGCWRPRHPLKGLCMESLIYKLTFSKLQQRSSSSNGVSDIRRGNKLTSCRERAGEDRGMAALFGKREVLGGTVVHLLSTRPSALAISWDHTSPHMHTLPRTFQWLFHPSSMPLLALQTFPKSLKGS